MHRAIRCAQLAAILQSANERRVVKAGIIWAAGGVGAARGHGGDGGEFGGEERQSFDALQERGAMQKGGNERG